MIAGAALDVTDPEPLPAHHKLLALPNVIVTCHTAANSDESYRDCQTHAAREGKCWDAVEKEMQLPRYESWPNYKSALPSVLRRYCGLWGRGT